MVDISAAIIFKNEIRCLERCLKSLQALKKYFSCEIVMADTGSSDGSRAIAEKYADVVFDFPWINDFAAARNAVLERCTGKWILVLDCDEWLDGDLSELRQFFKSGAADKSDRASVIVRNYTTAAFDRYGDIQVTRLMRRDAQPHFVGAIHESPEYAPGRGTVIAVLRETILHHDGYVMLNDGSEEGKKKRARNIELLREELKNAPDDLRRLLQYIPLGDEEEGFAETLRRAVSLVKEKHEGWQIFGPPLLARAVQKAAVHNLPELEEWIAAAYDMFPAAYSTRIDVAYAAVAHAEKEQDYKTILLAGEDFLKARKELKNDKKIQLDLMADMLQNDQDSCEEGVRIAASRAYLALGQPERALALLREINWEPLTAQQVYAALCQIGKVSAALEQQTPALAKTLFENTETSARADAAERKEAFSAACAALFEEEGPLAWRALLPLKGACVYGDAAALMNCESAAEADELLRKTEGLTKYPPAAIWHVLELGCAFPPEGCAPRVEELDALAAALSQKPDALAALAVAAARELPQPDAPTYFPRLLWARSLALAAAQTYDWKTEGENALALARAFAAVEAAFLPLCYTPEALGSLCALPPMHRFGICFARALEELDAGNLEACVCKLKEALEQMPENKTMTGFLLEEVRREERHRMAENASPELKALAGQVKAILAAYPPDDPAVAELKKSPAYQKVAYLIEE